MAIWTSFMVWACTRWLLTHSRSLSSKSSTVQLKVFLR
jgi:hypothetical protein